MIGFELAQALRRGSLLVAVVLFALLAAVASLLGLETFRQIGPGAVSPAAVLLLNLAVLFPPAFAMLAAAQSLQADREGGLYGMLRAAGVGAMRIALAKAAATTVAATLIVLGGFGAAAFVIAGNVPLGDLPVLFRVLVVAVLAAAAAAGAGVLVGAAASSRQQATTLAIALWFVFAAGLDLLLIGLAPVVRAGVPGLLALVALDPLESARILGLVALGADAAMLGPFGAFLRTALGPFGTSLALLAALALWIVGAPLLAAALLQRPLRRRSAIRA